MENPDKHQDQKNQATAHQKNNEPPREDGPDTEKYLEIEQPGVSYTNEGNPTSNSDYFETDPNGSEKYKSGGNNSRNSDAFSQDDYILNDNIDLDEDQNTSISSDDSDK